MKQHISKQQAQELNSEQIENLKILGVLPNVGLFTKLKWEEIALIITIGKIMEMLESEFELVACTYSNWQWVVYLEQHKEADDVYELDFVEKELVDALWQALKEVL